MPLYDYDCANCGQRFEVLRGVHAEPPTECPLCGGGPIKKAFTTPAIHFKGSGWAKKERRATSAPRVSSSGEGGGEGSGAGDSGDGGSSSAPKDAGKDAGTTTKDASPVSGSSGD